MANQKSDSEIGRVISRFQILDSLTTIGVGHDYKAKDLSSSQIVILKTLPKELISSKTIEDGLIEIIEKIKAIDHPRIYKILDIIKEEENLIYIVLPFIKGGLLEDKLNGNDLFTVDEVIHITKQIAEGLMALYSSNAYLEFYTSSNIFITEDNDVMIFNIGLYAKGISKIVFDSKNELSNSTVKINHIRWIGSLIVEMFNKCYPSEAKKQIPEEIISIIKKCLNKNTSDSYISMQNLLEDFYSIIPDSYCGRHHFYSKSTIQVEKKLEMHRKTILLLVSTILTFLALITAIYTVIKLLQ